MTTAHRPTYPDRLIIPNDEVPARDFAARFDSVCDVTERYDGGDFRWFQELLAENDRAASVADGDGYSDLYNAPPLMWGGLDQFYNQVDTKGRNTEFWQR